MLQNAILAMSDPLDILEKHMQKRYGRARPGSSFNYQRKNNTRYRIPEVHPNTLKKEKYDAIRRRYELDRMELCMECAEISSDEEEERAKKKAKPAKWNILGRAWCWFVFIFFFVSAFL